MSDQKNITTIALVVALVAVPGLLCLGLVAAGAAVSMMSFTGSEPVVTRPAEPLATPVEEPPRDRIPPLGGDSSGDLPEENLRERGLLGGTTNGEDTVGLDDLGTIGRPSDGDEGGSGYGHGAGGLRGPGARVPRIRTGNAEVRGSLSREVIRRVIRRHINEVRFCYEQQLMQDPSLEGRVDVSFIISPTGSVQSAVVRDTTLNDARVESCVTQAVRRWTFPAPQGGGVVGVNYPFVFSSSG